MAPLPSSRPLPFPPPSSLPSPLFRFLLFFFPSSLTAQNYLLFLPPLPSSSCVCSLYASGWDFLPHLFLRSDPISRFCGVHTSHWIDEFGRFNFNRSAWLCDANDGRSTFSLYFLPHPRGHHRATLRYFWNGFPCVTPNDPYVDLPPGWGDGGEASDGLLWERSVRFHDQYVVRHRVQLRVFFSEPNVFCQIWCVQWTAEGVSSQGGSVANLHLPKSTF